MVQVSQKERRFLDVAGDVQERCGDGPCTGIGFVERGEAAWSRKVVDTAAEPPGEGDAHERVAGRSAVGEGSATTRRPVEGGTGSSWSVPARTRAPEASVGEQVDRTRVLGLGLGLRPGLDAAGFDLVLRAALEQAEDVRCRSPGRARSSR